MRLFLRLSFAAILITSICAGFFAVGKVAAASKEAHTVFCNSGQQAKQVAYGSAVVVTCDDGNVAVEGTAGASPFTVNVSCPDGNTIFETGHDPAHQQVYICSNNNQPNSNGTAPSVALASGDPSAAKPGPAFQGDCNNGGVTLGVKLGSSNCAGGAGDNPIYAYLRGIIQFISGIFGLVAVLMIIISGIQYITSSGNPQAVSGAKKRLGNTVLGIILFLLMFAILNYLIPGGVFGA